DIPANRKARETLIISDPQPVDSANSVWTSAGHAALIGIFLLLFGVVLYLGRAILLPILAAAVLALTLAPLVKAAKRAGIPTWATAFFFWGLGTPIRGAMPRAKPVREWIARAPEIATSIRQNLAVLDQPLAALHALQPSLFGDSGGLNVSKPASALVLPFVAFATPA